MAIATGLTSIENFAAAGKAIPIIPRDTREKLSKIEVRRAYQIGQDVLELAKACNSSLFRLYLILGKGSELKVFSQAIQNPSEIVRMYTEDQDLAKVACETGLSLSHTKEILECLGDISFEK